jgi:propanediol dehydratase small subunit
MGQSMFVRVAVTLTTGVFAATSAWAQSTGSMDHASHAAMTGAAASAPAGQDAFATLSAVIAALEADSTTDWSRVNVEALRQHLIVMNDVTLGARVTQSNVARGAEMTVTGDGRIAQSIRAMLHAHAPQLEKMGTYQANVTDIPGGARLTVTASDASDTATVARIRALGFIGLLTLGNHHAQHHMALARGEPMDHR